MTREAKLYYDNTTDALYMAEKFDVQLHQIRVVDGTEVKFVDATTIAEHISIHDDEDYIYNVAPESLSVFEPREGDLVDVGSKDNPHYFVFTKSKNDEYYQNFINVPIIQRNNTPFINPKQEIENENKK